MAKNKRLDFNTPDPANPVNGYVAPKPRHDRKQKKITKRQATQRILSAREAYYFDFRMLMRSLAEARQSWLALERQDPQLAKRLREEVIPKLEPPFYMSINKVSGLSDRQLLDRYGVSPYRLSFLRHEPSLFDQPLDLRKYYGRDLSQDSQDRSFLYSWVRRSYEDYCKLVREYEARFGALPPELQLEWPVPGLERLELT